MTFEVIAIIAVTLLAVLVGACLPVLVQLARTLRKTQEFIESTGGRLERTLDQVDEAARRLNGVGTMLEAAGERARSFLEAAGTLGDALKDLSSPMRSMARMVKALGPAFLAGLRSVIPGGAPPDDGRDRGYTGNDPRVDGAAITQMGGTQRERSRKEVRHGE